jgi:hypothetical protein
MHNRQPLQHVSLNVSKLLNMRVIRPRPLVDPDEQDAERRDLDVIDLRWICRHERERHDKKVHSLRGRTKAIGN